jgi:hypothetical protein
MYVAIPNRSQCKLLIPVERELYHLSLRLYNPHSVKGKLMKRALSAFPGLARRFLAVEEDQYPHISRIASLLQDTSIATGRRLYNAYYLGTAGLYNKVTAQIMTQGGELLGFAKISNGDLSRGNLRNEKLALDLLNEMDAKHLLPLALELLETDDVTLLVQRPQMDLQSFTTGGQYGTRQHQFLVDLFKASRSKGDEADKERYTEELAMKLEAYRDFLDFDVITSAFKKYKPLFLQRLQYGYVHGDFAAWNVMFSKEKDLLYVFDWEYFQKTGPALYDVFHYIVQYELLIRHSAATELYNQLLHHKLVKLYQEQLELTCFGAYLFLYLLQSTLLQMESDGIGKDDTHNIVQRKVEMIKLLLESERLFD